MLLSSHLYDALTPKLCLKTIRSIVRRLREEDIQYDTLVCTGVSGISVVPTAAALLKKHLVVVRKGEQCHADLMIEYTGDREEREMRWIFVDDLVCTGQTYKRVRAEVKKMIPEAECVAALMYIPTNRKHSTLPDGIPVLTIPNKGAALSWLES